MTSPSPIYSVIFQYEKQRRLREIPGDSLYNHFFSLDAYEIRRVGYVTAEVRPDSLDKGYPLTEEYRIFGQMSGIEPGDDGAMLISVSLGGMGDAYTFPLNQSLDLSKWKSDEEKVYFHVKQGGNRYARLQYALKYNTEHEILRPSEIYYYFTLYKDGKVVGEPIENIFENTPPKIIKYEWNGNNVM